MSSKRSKSLNFKDPDTWGIQGLADHYEITPRAIRFYEDKGLLNPRREAGIRVFDHVDHARLERILRAKRLGFTLDDIKTVMDVMDGLVTDRNELATRKNGFDKVIKSLKRRRKDIDILAAEMNQLCTSIDDHLTKNQNDNGAFYMADAYQAAFEDHFADENMIENKG